MLEAAARAPSASKTIPVKRPDIGFLSFLTTVHHIAVTFETARGRRHHIKIERRTGELFSPRRLLSIRSRVKIQLQEITDRRLEARRGRPACNRLLGFDLYDQGVARQPDV